MTNSVTQDQALDVILAYGAQASRWPVEQRADVLALIATDPVVAAAHTQAAQLDALLVGWAADVPARSFDADALIPAPAVIHAPAKFRPARWPVPWLGAGALAASVAAALLLGVPGLHSVTPSGPVQIAQNQISDQVSLGSASAQAEPLVGFALIFTPTADEEDLI